MGKATLLFNQQLQASIAGQRADPHTITLILSASSHLDPFRATNSGLFGFMWIIEILSSGHHAHARYHMAGKVVELSGKEVDTHPPKYFFPDWVPPLLDFLSLSEKFYTQGAPPYPGFTALRILLCRPVDADYGATDFGAKLLPILVSTLSPTHPLQSRSLALKVLHRFMSGWFSQQMESVSNRNLDKLLQSVGDPFHFPVLPLQYGQHWGAADYEPTMTAVVLVEFASSDLWRNHLNPSNFTSCEELVPTTEGRRTALRCMLDTATHTWPTLLRTPAKITAAIRRLEELQCLNTAEVVILWAWTIGVVNVVGHDTWGSIERITLEFYRTHGIGRLVALKRHIVDTKRVIEVDHMAFLLRSIDYQGSPCRVDGLRRPVTITGGVEEKYFIDLRVSRVCQLRRLYHLFGYDPTTWEEAVGVEGVGEEMYAEPGGSVIIPS